MASCTTKGSDFGYVHWYTTYPPRRNGRTECLNHGNYLCYYILQHYLMVVVVVVGCIVIVSSISFENDIVLL